MNADRRLLLTVNSGDDTAESQVERNGKQDGHKQKECRLHYIRHELADPTVHKGLTNKIRQLRLFAVSIWYCGRWLILRVDIPPTTIGVPKHTRYLTRRHVLSRIAMGKTVLNTMAAVEKAHNAIADSLYRVPRSTIHSYRGIKILIESLKPKT